MPAKPQGFRQAILAAPTFKAALSLVQVILQEPGYPARSKRRAQEALQRRRQQEREELCPV